MSAAIAAAQAAGTQQGQSQAGGPAPGPGAATGAAPAPVKFNRYEGEIKEMQRNAAFGVFIPDLLKAQSKGQEDMARGIKLMIRKQYYTTDQVLRLLATFTAIGMMITAAIYTALWSKIEGKYYSSLLFGICTGAFSMMVYWWFVGANWHAVCNADNPYVDEDRHGMDCLDHSDCSIGAVSPNGQMCIQQRPKKFWRAIRGTLMLGLLGGAVASFALASSESAWDAKTVYAGVVFGAASGAFLWQIFPLDNNRRAAAVKK